MRAVLCVMLATFGVFVLACGGGKKDSPKAGIKFDRSKVVAGKVKDFAAFPEEMAGKCIRFDSVWIGGDFERVQDSREMTVTIEGDDGKLVFGVPSGSSRPRFVFSEKMGRTLSEKIESNKKHLANVFCEIHPAESTFAARVYRVELLNQSGAIRETHEDK